MARQAEDISKIEDIGERLDALLDALETSSSEVARVGSALDKPLAELLAEEPAAKPDPKPESPTPVAPEPETEAEPEPEPEAEAEAEVAEPEVQPEPTAEAEVVDEPESVVEEANAPEPVADAEPEQEVESQPEGVDPKPESEPEVGAASEPASEAEAAGDDTQLDDGLLIEPERYEKPPTDDIDGAPVGPLNLEEELDEELESLLASGEFEDPLAEMGVDESAEPLELPEESLQDAEDSLLRADALAEPEDRSPNLPTDEAELIGELDEQLAALADAQLAEGDQPEPVAASESVETPQAESAPAPSAAVPEQAKAEPAPEPEIVTKPVAPAPHPKQGWKLHAERAIRVAKPVAEKAMVRAGTLAVAGATRASAPLKDKPHVKQIVGWVGLVQAFLAGCVWTYLVLWHNPPQPPPETPQPTIVAPSEG
ncbi:MAG: hypothetical protein NCW75_00475 [Phycisphaera sp.]|nr:MAG: hypothetical protein NCW75_00475 [Phycisphaera sp.]